MRERLAPVLEERALLPMARVRSARAAAGGAQRRREVGRAARDRGARGGPADGPACRLAAAAVGAARARLRRAPTSARSRRCATSSAWSPRSARSTTRRCGPAAAGPRGMRDEGARPSSRPARAPTPRRRSCCGAWPRSRRPTSPARSRTSTPSSCTTCACRSGAPAPSCASCAACSTPRERARLRDELKWAQALTGPVRDLDVQLLEWPELDGRLAGERRRRARAAARAARAPPRARAGQARARAAQRALRRHARGVAGAGRRAARPPTRPRRRSAARADRAHGRRADREGVPADGPRRRARSTTDSPPEALHDLRKRGKELRYLLELFGGAFADEVVDRRSSGAQGPAGACSGASRTAPSRSSRCAGCATSSPPSPTGPRR